MHLFARTVIKILNQNTVTLSLKSHLATSMLSPKSDTRPEYNESKSSKAFYKVKAAPGALASARSRGDTGSDCKGWLKG